MTTKKDISMDNAFATTRVFHFPFLISGALIHIPEHFHNEKARMLRQRETLPATGAWTEG